MNLTNSLPFRFTKDNIYWVWCPFMFSLVVPKLPINETVDFWEGKNRCIKIKALKSYLKDWAESIASFVHCSYRLYPFHSLHENLSKKWPEWTGSRLVNLDGKDCFSNAVFLSSYQHHCGGQKRREGLEFLIKYYLRILEQILISLIRYTTGRLITCSLLLAFSWSFQSIG